MSGIMLSIFIATIIVLILLVLKISSSLNQQISSLTQQLNERLREAALALQDTHRTVGERMDSATRLFGDVQRSLGRLEETHKEIHEISKDIVSLQDLLRAPKFRGEIGETLLGRLLEDILPKDNLGLQHRFNNGDTVDAVIFIGKNIIPIDAKFPLENFRKLQEEGANEQKQSFYRQFVRDVKARIDEVSSKYILPDEGTFDFALMYIPAEGVYYQITKDEELSAYAKLKKVIFVSPNTFYAYLQAILYGLRGVNVQRNIQSILVQISRVQVDLKKFQDDFDVIGSHISNAAKRYLDAKNKLAALGEKISATTENKQIDLK